MLDTISLDDVNAVATDMCAHVLGFGQISADVSAAAQVLVHGADFYDDIYQAFEGVQSHDWRTAGAELGKVLNQLSEWTKGHACTSDYCYVVLGVFEFLGDIQVRLAPARPPHERIS